MFLALKTIFGCRCPACQKTKIFTSWLNLRDVCPECGLKIAHYDPQDGPAFFAMLLVSTVLIIAVVWVELIYALPGWAHLLLWVPCGTLLTYYSIKFIKAWLLSVNYKHDLKT